MEEYGDSRRGKQFVASNGKFQMKGKDTLSGFTGTCSKGDFYMRTKFVKFITFDDAGN